MNVRFFSIINRLLLLLLTVALTAIWLADSSFSTPVKEVHHALAGTTEVERCISCHRPENHPPVAGHDMVSEACTPCHNGMGRGITAATAHPAGEGHRQKGQGKRHTRKAARRDESPDALLAGDAVSAGCLRCHPPQRLPENTAAVQGWRLFTGRACGRCHQVEQVSNGMMGPDLSQIGDIRSLETLKAQIASPQASGLYSRMPALRLTGMERRQLVLFLKGQSHRQLRPAHYQVEQPSSNDPMARQACVGCHKYNGGDGGTGPDLDLIAAMRTPEWVRDFLRDPEALRSGARMSALGNAEEVGLVVARLMQSKPVRLDDPSPRKTYEQFCARCHGLAGDGRGLIAPSLAGAPRIFLNNAGFFRLANRNSLAKSVQNGIPGTAMPPFARLLTETEIKALLADLEYRFAGLGSAMKVADLPVPERLADLRGDGAGLYASSCTRCHGERGDRALHLVKKKRPPQPRNFRNRTYMDAVADQQIFRAIARGIPGTGMKAYQTALPGTGVRQKDNLRDEDVWRLVDHVRRLSRNE